MPLPNQVKEYKFIKGNTYIGHVDGKPVKVMCTKTVEKHYKFEATVIESLHYHHQVGDHNTNYSGETFHE